MAENLKSINFSSLINPDSFNKKQARQFITYVINDSNFKKSLISGDLKKSLEKFTGNISKFIKKPKAEKKLIAYGSLIALMEKPAFKKYLSKIKSIIASRSIIQAYFNSLARQNSSEKGKPSLAKTMKDMAMQPLSASNLQNVQTSSPATVQRMLLIAELRNNFLLYQLHQDLTMQSGLSALQAISNINARLTSMQQGQNALKKEVDDVNKTFK